MRLALLAHFKIRKRPLIERGLSDTDLMFGVNCMHKNQSEIELLKQARRESGLPMDFWDEITEGLDYSSLARLCGKASLFPKYMKSIDKP